MAIGVTTRIYERDREEILTPVVLCLKRLDEDEHRKLFRDVRSTFEAYKQSRTAPDGTVLVFERLGALPPYNDRHLAANTVAAWKCAGPIVRNWIDLAFWLLADGFKPFMDLLTQHGTAQVFAATGVMAAGTRSIHSLLRLSSLLYRALDEHDSAMASRLAERREIAIGRAKQNAALAEGRKASLATRTKGARDRSLAKEDAKLRKQESIRAINHNCFLMAVDYFLNHPSASVDDCIDYLLPFKDLKNYQRGTLKKKIQGANAEAKQSVLSRIAQSLKLGATK